MSKYRCTSCDLVIKNELIVSLLSPDNQDILSNINKETTKTVTDLVCPTLTNNKAPSKLCFISLQNATKCSNNFTPANVLLYGTIICNQLNNLNILGLTNAQIRALDQKYKFTWPLSVQFDSDRLGNNKRIQNFPLLIIYPKSTCEIQFWIKLTRQYSLSISVRSGGHSYEGFCNNGQIIIDTSYLNLPYENKQISINRRSQTVDVTPGVRLGPLYAKVAKKNFQLIGGICPSVAIGGYITGLGVGYFIRKYGYGCDSLLEADIVLADGSLLTVNKDKNSK